MLRIELDQAVCTQCGRCVDACPIPCFTFDEKEERVMVVNEDGCLVCRNCEEECPNTVLQYNFLTDPQSI